MLFDKSNLLPHSSAYVDSRVRRVLVAYPAIFLACQRQHVRDDETGKTITEHQRALRKRWCQSRLLNGNRWPRKTVDATFTSDPS